MTAETEMEVDEAVGVKPETLEVVKTVEATSELTKEHYDLTWTIENFNMVPFIREHPLYGPFIRLGKKEDSTWQLLLSKERGEDDDLPSLGFKLLKTEDNAVWDVCRYDITVRSKNGDIKLMVVENGLASGEEDIPYTYVKGALEEVCKNEDGEEQQSEDSPFKARNGKSCVVCDPETEILRDLRDSPVKARNGKSCVVCDPETEILRDLRDSPVKARSGKSSERGDQETEKILQALFKEEVLVVECDIRYTYMPCDLEEPFEETPQRLIAEDLKRLFKTQKYCDVVLRAGKKGFPCHKSILCARALGFDKMLHEGDGIDKLDLQDVSESVAELMLMYIYTGELPAELNTADCYGLFKVAIKYAMKGLKDLCLNQLQAMARDEPLCDDCDTEEATFQKLVTLELMSLKDELKAKMATSGSPGKIFSSKHSPPGKYNKSSPPGKFFSSKSSPSGKSSGISPGKSTKIIVSKSSPVLKKTSQLLDTFN